MLRIFALTLRGGSFPASPLLHERSTSADVQRAIWGVLAGVGPDPCCLLALDQKGEPVAMAPGIRRVDGAAIDAFASHVAEELGS